MTQVTASFQLFSIDGLQVAFSMVGESDNPAKFIDGCLAMLYKDGYRVEPVEGDLRPQIVPIVGYVRTSSQDGTTGQFHPAMALFSPWGDFSAITVYREKIAELPFEPQGKVWDGGAFDRKLITSKGFLTPCNMKIMKEPVMDYEGKPKLTEKGNQKWRFVRVVEYDGQAVAESSEAPTNGHVQDAPTLAQKPVQAAQAQPAVNATKAPVSSDLDAKKEAIRSFAGDAKSIYGDEAWKLAVVKIGSEVAKKQINGLTELTIPELQKVSAIVKLDKAGIAEYVDVSSWHEALGVFVEEFGQKSVYELNVTQICAIAGKLLKDIPW